MEQNEFNQLVKKSFEDSPQYKKVFKKVILDNNNHIYLHLINEGVLSLDLKEFKRDISDKGLSYATSCLNDSFKKQLDKLNTKQIFTNNSNIVVDAEYIDDYDSDYIAKPLYGNIMLVLKKLTKQGKVSIKEDEVNKDIDNIEIWNNAIENTCKHTNISISPEILVNDDFDYYKEFMKEVLMDSMDENAMEEFIECAIEDIGEEAVESLDMYELFSEIIDTTIGSDFLHKEDFAPDVQLDFNGDINMKHEYEVAKKAYNMFAKYSTSLFTISDNNKFAKHFYTFITSPCKYITEIFDASDCYILPLSEYSAYVYVVGSSKKETIQAIKNHQNLEEGHNLIIIRYSSERQVFIPEMI